ncbi:MAG: hypothetical protein KJO95_11295 [Gammaproteobacteria bacterium]|nr:hypothetical protein [Gammaproteobacteria bacterium]MBU2676134.1 hypothetical protein [Gammaproteobacteria bacterium]NNC57054.1 hypothetical protein [Woeseiaceae bacterium]NNL49870.1 hypothetical protein [Woeseiaceae bacterium]
MNELPETKPGPPDRRTLVRDIAVLQAKLIVDGLRDLLLVPASLIVGIVSLVSSGDGRPGHQFYRLLSIGKQSERWINLFGALKNAPADLEMAEPFPNADMDDLVGRLETFVVDEHKRGGITAQAKRRFDKALDAIQSARRRGT